MDKETADEIVGRALRGEPYVPTGGGDDTPAQPAAPQCVAYADAHGAIMAAAYDFRDAHISGSPNQKRSAHAALESAVTHALRASNGQAPAAGITLEQVEDAIGLQSAAWDTIGAEKIVEAVLRLAKGQAPAAGAVAGMPPGISALMCVISSLRDTAHFSDEEGELTDELRTLRDWAMTQAAAPTPAAQADSQPAPQGEMNVQLDTDSNPTAPGQQRDMACSLALGQPVGNGQDQAAGHLGAQGDKLLTVAERNIRSFLHSAPFKSESDREAALNCVDVLWEAARAAESVLEDAARLDWLLLRISGAEFRRLGVHYSGNAIRADVDAARKQGGAA